LISSKSALGTLSLVVTAAAYAIYIRKIQKGSIQPHPYSWLLWFLVTAVAFVVQRTRGGGPGSWVTGATAAVCFVISILSFIKYRSTITRFDRFSLALGTAVLLFYVIVRSAVPSAIFATVADVIGYIPTIKNAWKEPDNDSAVSFFLNGLKFLIALPALESRSLATYLYPSTILIMNLWVSALLLMRRWQIHHQLKDLTSRDCAAKSDRLIGP